MKQLIGWLNYKKNGFITVNPQQMIQIIENIQKNSQVYDHPSHGEVINSQKATLENELVDKTINQNEKDLNEITNAAKTEKPSSTQEDEQISKKLLANELGPQEENNETPRPINPEYNQLLNQHNSKLIRDSKSKNPYGNATDFLNKPTAYVNNQLGKLFGENKDVIKACTTDVVNFKF
jgi:hypothetical protein